MNSFYHRPESAGQSGCGDLGAFLPQECHCVIGREGLEEHYALALQGQARLFVECPEVFPGLEFSGYEYAENLKVRPVVTTDAIPDVPELSIVTMHNFAFRKVVSPVGRTLLSASKVAGYRRALFGLTEECYPLLFFHPESENILISTVSLANFRRGRFAPLADWRRIIGFLLGFLAGDDVPRTIQVEPPVHPAYGPSEQLPQDAEEAAFKRCVDWFRRENIYNYHGAFGVFEGFSSIIDEYGDQHPMPEMRGDCMGEAALPLAAAFALTGQLSPRELAGKLLKTLFTSGRVSDINPASQTYGSLWFSENLPVVYGDDNSRAGFGAVLAGELLDWKENTRELIRMAYSLLRTTGPTGLREPVLLQPAHFIGGKAWKYYRQTRFEECRPHYQAFHWAFNLQMYALTGDPDFLNSTKTAMQTAYETFPDFLWQNSATSDWARILLPFAMLAEVERTPENLERLRKVARFFIGHMNEYGTVPELMGKRELGKYPSPSSNKDYGKTESALVQENGDPACDLLYTVNYAFIGLHEAYMATGDPDIKAACDRMADFFCRVQVRSSEHHALDGCWMRGFDFSLWEFFGNSSDSGWGPWCVETGWTNAWIAVTFALRKLNRPLLCLRQKELFTSLAPEIKHEMFGQVFRSVTKKGTFTEVDMNIRPKYMED